MVSPVWVKGHSGAGQLERFPGKIVDVVMRVVGEGDAPSLSNRFRKGIDPEADAGSRRAANDCRSRANQGPTQRDRAAAHVG